MKIICKRLLSLLLVFVLVLGLMPSVYAATDDGTSPTTETATAETTAPQETVTDEITPTTETTETTEPTEATEPTETTEVTETTEATEPSTEPDEELEETQPTEAAKPDKGPPMMAANNDGIMLAASTQSNIMLFDFADNGNYTTVLNSQLSVSYKPNGSGTTRTAYIKNLGWHFARYGNVPYADDPLYCIEPWRNYGASTSGNSVDRDVTLNGSSSTASDGDVIDYQIVSSLPAITSESTYLDCYTFIDTLSPGLTYNKNDIVIEFFKDADCTDLITTWTQADGKFNVTYNTTTAKESTMTIEMTERGLSEINTAKTVYTGSSMVNSGYSDCTIRITYAATMNSDDSVIYGDSGNPNKVVLTWKRSSDAYYDTLIDDAHVFTYAVELTKLFSDGQGKFENVEFIMQNANDGYYVKAELNAEEGIYYVVDHVANKADATHFVPVANADKTQGLVIIKGLEDDTYLVTEVKTDNGYTLLKDAIEIEISQVETAHICDIYEDDVLGLIQNDPRYATIINDTGDLKNMPQTHLEHHLLTASATVDGNDVNMLADDGSVNASVPLKVVNTKGFDLPQTGDHGTWMFSVIGIVLMAGAAAILFVATRKKNTNRQ